MKDVGLRSYLGFPHVREDGYGWVASTDTSKVIDGIDSTIKAMKKEIEQLQFTIKQLTCNHNNVDFYFDVHIGRIGSKTCKDCNKLLCVYENIEEMLCAEATYKKEKADVIIGECNKVIKEHCLKNTGDLR